MAELNDKFHVKSGNVTQEITCYTTLDEVSKKGIPIMIKGINAYMAYGDTEQSLLNCKVGDIISKVQLSGKIPYGIQTYTTVGTYTFTTPAGVTKVRVTASAGGGGGGGGSYSSKQYGMGGTGGRGGNCINRIISVSPNTTYSISVGGGGAGGFNYEAGSGTRRDGYAGGNGGSTNFGDLLTCTGGIGGNPATSTYNSVSDGSGGANGTPYEGTLSYGGGGTGIRGAASGTWWPATANNGAVGFMQIEWGGDIR